MLVTIAAAGLACSGSAATAGDAGIDAGGGADGGGGPAVTYYQDVAPILQAKCIPCHVAGGIAPFALDTPEAAVGLAGAMKAITQVREMPPWPPGPLSPKMLHDRSLTDAQIATFAAWADGGAPLGDAAHPAPPGQPDSRIGLSGRRRVGGVAQRGSAVGPSRERRDLRVGEAAIVEHLRRQRPGRPGRRLTHLGDRLHGAGQTNGRFRRVERERSDTPGDMTGDALRLQDGANVLVVGDGRAPTAVGPSSRVDPGVAGGGRRAGKAGRPRRSSPARRRRSPIPRRVSNAYPL